jgi:hypothetical protein
MGTSEISNRTQDSSFMVVRERKKVGNQWRIISLESLITIILVKKLFLPSARASNTSWPNSDPLLQGSINNFSEKLDRFIYTGTILY